MGYFVQQKPTHNTVKVFIMERYLDEDQQPRTRPVNLAGSSMRKDKIEDNTKSAALAVPWLGAEPPRIRQRSEALLDLVCEERQSPQPHYEPFLSETYFDQFGGEYMRIGPREVFGTLLNRAGIDELFDGKFAIALRVLRAEITRHAFKGNRWYHDSRYHSYLHNGSQPDQKRARMFDRLTPKRIDRLRSYISNLLTATLGSRAEEAILLMSTKKYEWRKQFTWQERQEFGPDKREPRAFRLQATLAILLTPEGVPMDFWAFPQKPADGDMLASVHADIQRRHGDLRVAVMADPSWFETVGMENVAAAGFGHITAVQPHDLPPEPSAELRKLSRYAPLKDPGTSYHTVESDGQRFIACRVTAQVQNDSIKRQNAFARAEFSAAIKDYRANPYLDKDPDGRMTLRRDLFKRNAVWDGVWCLSTDLQRTPTPRLLQLYNNREAALERFDFALLDPYHDPASYWTDERFVAHAAVSFCAQALVRLILCQLNRPKKQTEVQFEADVLQEINDVRGSVICDARSSYHFHEPDKPTSTQQAVYRALGLRLPENTLPLGFVTSP